MSKPIEVHSLEELECPDPKHGGEDAPLLPGSEDVIKMQHPAFFALVTIPMFMGYATLFSMQEYLEDQLHIPDGSSTYSLAYSFLYWGNLLFRAGHNYVFVWCSPYWRIMISFLAMSLAEIILIITMGVTWKSEPTYWVAFVIYALGGVGIGTFEANVLNVACCVSPEARTAAVAGIPVGVNIISIGAYLIIGWLGPGGADMAIPTLCQWVYGIVILCLFGAGFIMLKYVPKPRGPEIEATTSVDYLPEAFRHWREWLPAVLPNALTMMVNMFTVSEFSPGLVLYEYDDDDVIDFKWLPFTTTRGYFQAMYGVFTFCGDFFSRLTFANVRRIFPPLLLLFNLAGICLVLTGIPDLQLLAPLFIMWGNGVLYVQTSRWIKEVTKDNNWNLAAYSFWLFVGDCGSVIASSVLQSVLIFICVDLNDSMPWQLCPYYG
eukprot:gnl/Dysnectes_brevis/459_a511_4796.p1 GENE.gnl/Dysnectes_brevis/459_a511_4796~~gnl/Dysnectes_brevis/459_a511_4796.p1  ORF type:complete len:434 (-),score=110.69 gnl/Dysnectes_brevis/459_a511_4796:98-1399(-)